RIVCDRARMVAAIRELEAIRLVSANLRMGRVSTIGSRAMVAAVISELEARHFVYVTRRIGRMRSIVGLRGRRRQVIGRALRPLVRSDGGELDVRIGAPMMAVIRWGRLHRGVVIGCVG